MSASIRTRAWFASFIVATVFGVVLTELAVGQTTTPPAAAPPSPSSAKPAAATPAAATPEAAPAASAPAGGEAASSKDLLEKGVAALKAGDFPAAIEAFAAAGRAAEQTPGIDGLRDRAAAIVGRGRALTGLKEYTAALETFTSIITEDPQNVPALVARGQVYLEQNRPDDALNDFQKAAQTDLGNLDAQFGMGKSLVQLGRGDEAITPLTRVLTAAPKNAESLRLRGQAYTAVFKSKQAIEDLQQAISLNPDDYESYFYLGAVKFRNEDYQDAVDQFGKAIEHYKPKPGQEDLPYVQGYLTRAAALLELGKVTKDPAAQKAAYQASHDEAQKVVDKLELKNPTHARPLAAALFSRGVAERMLGQLGQAIRTITQAIELRSSSWDDSTGPFLSDAYFRRGICFHLIGEEKMAISDFEAASHLTYGDPRANLWEGFTYAKLGDYHKALRAYGDAIAASDRYTPAYYNRSLTYMMMGDYKKAVADLNDAIRLDPTNAEYYFKRGVAYQQLSENKKASESFAAALEFDNKHAGAYRHMADVLQKLNRSDLANQYRQKADELAPPKKAP